MIVMKFGGTSLGNAARFGQVVSLVKSRIKEKPIVVVSAVGGITDLLIQGAKQALTGKFPEETFKKMKNIHLGIIEKHQLGRQFVEVSCEELSRLYRGILSLREFTGRTHDLVVSFGERISARLLAECFQKNGVPAKAYDSWEVGFTTNSSFTHSRLLPESEKKIQKTLRNQKNLPIITGFIGKDSEGRITTLGRGGSDLTASLIGAAVGVETIEIWTDVSGIMTADPKIVPKARTLPSVSFQEAAELSYFGAKILHPQTIEPAMKKNIPVLVKNTFHPEHPGTLILPGASKKAGLKAITAKKGITILHLYSTGMLETHGFLVKVFQILDQQKISVDVVSTSEVSLSLTLDNTDGLNSAVPQLSEFAEVFVEKDRAIICLVGEGLKNTPGVAGRVFSILGNAKINIEMISQGASQINLTFLVESANADKSIKLLHQEFFE